MNNDFENKLRQQSLRRAPAGWREQILDAATAKQRRSSEVNSIPLWQMIFGRYPVAAAAFGGFWVLLIVINAFLFGAASPSHHAQAVARTEETSSVWNLQSEALQQIASDDPSLAPDVPVPPSQTTPPNPRSELRREDEGMGEVFSDHSLNFIA